MSDIEEQIKKEEFKIRTLSEAETISRQVADEIKDVLRKHGASLAEWNHKIYIVPPGFKVYSEWDSVIGIEYKPSDTGLNVQPYGWSHKIVKTLPTKTVK